MEFKPNSYCYVHYIITHNLLSITRQFNGNISGGKIFVLFLMQSSEYSQENLSPIGFKLFGDIDLTQAV
jgi:hypothetical protein